MSSSARALGTRALRPQQMSALLPVLLDFCSPDGLMLQDDFSGAEASDSKDVPLRPKREEDVETVPSDDKRFRRLVRSCVRILLLRRKTV